MDPILIVDDEKDNLEALHRLIRRDYEVVTMASPVEALKAIQKREFHVIISDQRMPEMTGVDLLEKSKTISPRSVRILLTGYTDLDSVIDAINRGSIYRYVSKPWDPEDLKLTLRQANEAYRLRKEVEEKRNELELSHQQLHNAFERLKTLDRAKARFLGLVSHELNTPLTILNSFYGLLSSSEKDFPDDVKLSLKSMGSALGRLGDIVNEVLSFTQIEANPELDRRPCELKPLLDAIHQELVPVLAKTKVQWLYTVSGKVRLNADSAKLHLGIKKWVEDAIQRSPQGKAIKLSCENQGTEVRLTLWRQGEAISKDALSPLETVLRQDRHHKNLGIGLAICRLVVEAHGGVFKLVRSDDQATETEVLIPQ